jgi:type II restriction enzyme
MTKGEREMKELNELLVNNNLSSNDEYFRQLKTTFKKNITTWDYFVNWSKVFGNLNNVERELNLLNYLVGKPITELRNELKETLKEYPKVAKAIPLLVAFRENNTQILTSYKSGSFAYKEYNFSYNKPLSDKEIDDVVEFVDKSTLINLISEGRIKNLVDYVIGVEVGLDSNARKNRTGTLMENIVETFVEKICGDCGFEYLSQANSKKILEKWGIKVTVDKSSRIIDFAIRTKNKLFLIETNFYAGGGSKLKSTAGEYKTMFEAWKRDGHQFIWITDGEGWQTALLPLQETFNYIDYLLNLNSISKGDLEIILKKEG